MTHAPTLFQRFRNIPFSTRLPSYVTLTTIFSLVGATFFGLSVALKTAEQKLISELASLRADQVEYINHELGEARKLAQALSSYGWVREHFESNAEGRAKDHSDFETIFESYELEEIFLADARGQVFYIHTNDDTDRAGEAAKSKDPELERAISSSRSDDALFDGFGFGVHYDSSAQSARAASGAFLAQAVYSDAGGKIGAIVLQISAQDFEEALKKLGSMKNSATAFILDQTGQIVLSEDKDGAMVNEALLNRIGAERLLESGQSGQFVFEPNSDKPLLVTYGRFNVVNDVYTSVVVADYYTALNFMGDLQLLMLLGAVVSSVFVGVVSVMIIRFNLSDTKSMNSKLRSIAESRDFTRRIESNRNDEIG